ncbi:hypothetical protein FV219_01370 [Methylobacterium sp. WL122]|nr:hypothetical protein FV219_01370 [Methylobacterium sp. WL122]
MSQIEQEQAQRAESLSSAVRGTMEGFSTKPQPINSNRRHPRNETSEIDDARDALSEAILETARWRLEKAEQFPNEPRNTPAVELLKRIAASVIDVPDDLMRRYSEAWHDEMASQTSETQSVRLRDIRFRSASATATTFVEHLMEHVDDARSGPARG